MAGEKNKIVIVIEGVEELKPQKAEDKSPTKKQKKKLEEDEISASQQVITGTFGYIKDTMVPVVTGALKMGWNRYTTLQEDYLAENRVNNVMTSVNKVKSLTNSVVSGAMTGATVGSAAGPVGTAVGLLMGTMTSLAMWGTQNNLENQQKLSNYYQQLNQTNFQTYLDSSRAGLVDNGRGTQN